MSLLTTRTGGRVALACTLILGSSMVAACGGGSKASKNASAKPASAATAGSSVAIDTFMFSPKTLHVHVGDTVTWTNKDNILHTVTSGNRDYEPGDSGHVTATHKDGLVDMQLDGRGSTATHTFTNLGTFHYFCDRHPGMEADVEVS